MKKLIIALFITTAFSSAYGMEKEQKRTSSNTFNITSQLNRKNVVTSFLGLGTAACAYLTYLAFTADNEWYDQIRENRIIFNYLSDPLYARESLINNINFNTPKILLAVFPALATYMFGNYLLKEITKKSIEPEKS